MVTAHNRDELFEQSEGIKVDGVLIKPVCPSALLDSILSALGKEVITRRRKDQRLASHDEAEESLRGAYVLLVEDNVVNQELALEILQNAGVRVDLAGDGAQAVEMVGRADYDGVLMDCQMPVMDGFEATRRIRADARFATLPILAMTANATTGSKDLCLAVGMNDHIGKPINVTQLFAMMVRWIKPKAGSVSDVAAPKDISDTSNNPDSLSAAPSLPVIPRLDLDQAMRRMDGNLELVRKITLRFAETQAGAIARVTDAIDGNDIVTATREVHTTKGLAGNIGATQLMALSAKVENILKHHQMENLPSALLAWKQELTEVITQIKEVMGPGSEAEKAAASTNTANLAASSNGATPPPMINRETLTQAFNQLTTLLTDNDTRAGKLADSISITLQGTAQGVTMGQINQLITEYEFEEALDKLTEAAQALDIPLHTQRTNI
jgi:two-component system sensor histidine kinase/response regulator